MLSTFKIEYGKICRNLHLFLEDVNAIYDPKCQTTKKIKGICAEMLKKFRTNFSFGNVYMVSLSHLSAIAHILRSFGKEFLPYVCSI